MPSAKGRPRRSDGPAKVRPGTPLTDAEWAPIVAYRDRHALTTAEAQRRVLAAGVVALGIVPNPDRIVPNPEQSGTG